MILAGPMMIVAVLGLLVNVLVLWIMTRGDRSRQREGGHPA